MAYSRRAKPIEEKEWDKRKARIVELYEKGRLQDVIDGMAREDFTATRAQYEAHFRIWGIRKYENHQAGSENNQGTSRATFKRNRRNATGLHHEAHPVPPHHNDANQSQGHHIAGFEADIGIQSTENVVEVVAVAAGTEFQGIGPSQNMQLSGGDNNPDHSFVVESSDGLVPPTPASNKPDRANLVELSSSLPESNDFSFMYPTGLTPPPDGSSSFDPMDLVELTDLPLESYDFGFAGMDGLIPSQRLINFAGGITPILSNGRGLFKHTSVNPLPSFKVGAMIIKNIYSESLAATPNALERTNNSLYRFSNLTSELGSSGAVQIPNRLYSRNVFAGEDWSLLGKIPEAVAAEARIDIRLITSFINGCTDLGNIPYGAALKFLQRSHDMEVGVFNYFDTASDSVAISFAESIFSASVESDTLPIVIYLLNKKLVDVNKAVCHFRGERYTPLEAAAINQSLSVVKYFVSRVDVNKTFPRNKIFLRAWERNALELLINYAANKQSTLGENFIQLVDDFLEAKATISIGLVQMVLEQFVDGRLGSRLLKKLATQEPHALVAQNGLLLDIIENLAEQDATEIVKLIIGECRESGRERALYQPQQIDSAFGEAAKRQYNELVRAMLPYASPPPRAPEIAIALNEDAIQLIPENNPGLDRYQGSEEVNIEDIISALQSNDQDLLRHFEKTGVFNRLQDYKLGRALTEALRVGNREYATKILDLDPDFRFSSKRIGNPMDDEIFNVSGALSDALAHDFDDIAWKLLAIGLTIKCTFLRPNPLLAVAVDAKKPDFMRAIIQSSFDSTISSDQDWLILESAFASGQDSIFDDILKACLSARIFPTVHLLKFILQRGNEDLFFEVIDSSLKDGCCQTNGLAAAVECEAEQLFDRLIFRGARVDDDEILETAMKHHPSMVKPLLDRYWNFYPEGRVGYCHSIIREALDGHPKPHDGLSMDMLFTWGLINRNHLCQEEFGDKTLLVIAIETRDYEIIERFIDASDQVNATMRDEHYPRGPKTAALLAAIETKDINIIRLLIDGGAEVNEPARYGLRRTPLQKAAEMNSYPMVHLLLNSGANVNSEPAMFDGATALQFAAIHGNCDIAKLLIDQGAEASIPPPRGVWGRWPLEGAAENGRFDMIELLWNAFGPFPNEQCQSALLRAERNGHFGCKKRIEELMAESSAPHNLSFPTISSIT
ncbi:hypothetical protein F5Y10DRAFT_292347 [Nemania abortiva]|nr:hypothetical protein F5Y10DRAFT_292347 [Nemania abortiva]